MGREELRGFVRALVRRCGGALPEDEPRGVEKAEKRAEYQSSAADSEKVEKEDSRRTESTPDKREKKTKREDERKEDKKEKKDKKESVQDERNDDKKEKKDK